MNKKQIEEKIESLENNISYFSKNCNGDLRVLMACQKAKGELKVYQTILKNGN